MKKIYLFLLTALGLMVSTNVSAQVWFEGDEELINSLVKNGYTIDYENPLITDVWEQLYGEEGELNPCCDSGEGSEWALLEESKPDEVTNRNSQDFWHSNWHNGNQPAGSHYLQVKMIDDLDPEAYIAFVFKRRPADNDHTIEWSVWGTNDPAAAKEQCDLLVESIETPFGNNTETLMSSVFKRSDYQYLRFYSEQQHGASYGSRGYFHMSRFNIFPAKKLSELEAAMKELQGTVNQYYLEYDKYLGILDMHTGDAPGDYSEAAVQEFIDALDIANERLEEADFESIDEIKACSERIVNAYNAIPATKVPFRGLASGYYRIRAGMEYSTGDKYMLGYRSEGKLYGIWGTPDLDIEEDNIQALWKITAVTDSTYDVVNMYHDGRFMKVGRSASCEMTTDEAYADSLLAFDAAGTDHIEEISFVNIRLDMQEAGNYFYIHQGGHSNGAGNNGYLVGWSNTWNESNGMDNNCGASEWWFEEVPEDEAREIIDAYNKDTDIKKDEFKTMLDKAPGMLEIARDVQKIYDEELPLISDENPITSPCSDSAEGQHIEYLWDGDTGNFWHTDWHGEFTAEDHHYFQVEITDPEAYASALFTFTRRNTTSGNQIDKWNVVGYEEDDFDLVQEDGELLAEITTPYHAGNNTESYVSDPFETKGYQFIRFYCAGTRGNDGGEAQSKFMHLAEFQVYPGHVFESETSQYKVMGDVAKNLEEALAEFEDYDMEAFDVADYEALKPIYDAFVKIYVDPTPLRDAIATNKNAGDKVVAGTDPGFWPNTSTKDALESDIAAAKAYDEAGAYTPEKSEELIAAIEADAKAIDEAPINKFKEGKWYRLRFGTEAEYDQYKWSKTGNAPNYWIDDSDSENPDTLGMYNAGLFGKYVAVAKRENVVLGQNDENNDVNGSEIVPIAKEDVRLDQSLHAIDLDKLTDPDMALFRFINVGDSAWAIQNKATGLFIHHDVYLSVQPGLFTQTISGYGQNAFFNKTVEGNGKSPLHMAQSQSVLCAWGNESGSGWTDADGRRGSFFVEEVADVAADYAFGDFSMKFTPGDIYGRCYPVPVTLKSDNVVLWTVSNIERTPAVEDGANEQVKVTLVKIDPAVPAGRPFFFVAKGEMPEEGDEEGVDYQPVIADLSFTFDLVNAPQTSGYLKGTFDSKTINERFLTTGTGHADQALEWKASGSSVGVNRVYITDIAEGAEPFSRKAEIAEITFDENGVDGIATVIQNVSREGGIYSIDGRYMGKGNLNNLSKLGRGVYILNGTKVTVK